MSTYASPADAPTLEIAPRLAGTLVPEGAPGSSADLFADEAGLAPLPELPAPWQDPVLMRNGVHSQIFEVVDANSRRAAVLKTLPPGADRAARDGLRREAAVLLSLDARGTPRLLAELQLDDGRPALVLTRAPGLHLGEWRRRLGRIPTDAAVAATVDACAVLHQVHQAGLIHTDLRPSHILRDVRGQIHIVDWHHAAPSGARSSGRASPTVAPELRNQPAPVGPATDVWGLTATLVHLLTGTAPPALDHGPAGARIPLPSDPLLSGTPGKLFRSVIARGLDPEPALRIPTADALARELSGWRAAFGAVPR